MGRIKAWAGVAVVLLLMGAMVGFTPVSSGGAGCGSVLNPQDGLVIALDQGDVAAHGCESLLSVIMIPTWMLLTLGAAGLVVALVWASIVAADEPRAGATV
ncbi:MAG TPA: hypothetical protein VNP20_18315 [Nocardioidaceae bacterium]|nr:hypothetical protein [Nocardioidaceae bacterium]